jgi:hypothetical protein
MTWPGWLGLAVLVVAFVSAVRSGYRQAKYAQRLDESDKLIPTDEDKRDDT